MRRPLWCGVVCSLGLVVTSVSAPGAEPIRQKAAHRRIAVEKILEQPLEWQLDERQQVTLAELIKHVHEQQGLSIRWDAATFQMLSGGTGGGNGLAIGPTGGARGLCGYNCPPPLGYSPDVQYFTSPPSNGVPTYSAPLLGTVVPAGLPPASVTPLVGNPLQAGASSPPLPLSPVGAPPSGLNPLPAVNLSAAAQPRSGKAATPEVPSAPLSSAAGTKAPATGPNAPIAPLVADEPEAIPPMPPAQATAGKEEAEKPLHEQFAQMPVSRAALSLEGATIEEGLRQMLDAALPPIGSMGEDLGIPMVTRAMTLDYVIEGNSVLITTQLRANTRKETRVYRISHLKAVSPESLARVITHAVRPWSWRNQATEIAEQLAARWPKGDLLKLPLVNFDGVEMLSGIKLTSGQGVSPDGSGVTPAGGTGGQVSDEAIAATGQLLAGGAVATMQSIVAALEIVHHGDPPTGVIESLPGMLVITQSQGAHREIAALLDELAASAE